MVGKWVLVNIVYHNYIAVCMAKYAVNISHPCECVLTNQRLDLHSRIVTSQCIQGNVIFKQDRIGSHGGNLATWVRSLHLLIASLFK